MAVARYDYVIAGGGTAACVLAGRLTENPRVNVLVLEAGHRYRGLSVQVPASIGDLYRKGQHHWHFTSDPEPHCNERRLPYKLGRILGGSSAINGLVWARGNPADYDEWAAISGSDNWCWQQIEPVFRRIEQFEDTSDLHMGRQGPVGVTRGSTTAHELNHAFLVAAGQAGFPVIDNYHGAGQDGFSQIQRNTQAGHRSDVYAGYLKQALRRRNLTVLTQAQVQKLSLDGTRVTGLEYRRKSTVVRVEATREVLLCAGALASPQLLMLSGIGPVPALEKLGIDPVLDLPGVGDQLHTHPTVKLTFSCRKAVSLLSWTKAPGKWMAGLEWLFRKQGPASSNHFETGGFMRSRPGLDRPDLQFTFVPLLLGELYGNAIEHGFEVYVVLVGGQSRGWTRPVSANPFDAPRFCFNFLEQQSDIDAMLAGCMMARKIVAQAAFSELAGTELSPGPELVLGDAWLRNNISVTHHLAGSCRMGAADDAQSVVGPDLHVHGLQGIRVVDASIMPRVTSGNTHAPVIMIAERASEFNNGTRACPGSTQSATTTPKEN